MTRKRHIWIEPHNGLCNRLRAMDSAIQFANDYDYRLILVWNLGSGMNCPFDRIWSRPTSINKIISWSSLSRHDALLYRLRRFILQRRGVKMLTQSDIGQILSDPKSVQKLATHNHLYISTGSCFYGENSNFCDWSPTATVTKLVEDFSHAFVAEKMIGVHIRRGDHRLSRKLSPTRVFIERLEHELSQHENVGFFLASDDLKEIATLKTYFGSKLMAYPKDNVDRNKPRAIELAMIELLLLAQTEKIIGSAASSFSETAAQWGGIPLELATQPD